MTDTTDRPSAPATPPLLAGRVALVTGASRGIGAATAVRLGAHGAAVGVNYMKSEADARAVAARIAERGGRAVAVQGDVGSAAEVERMVLEVTRALGDVDALVLNATAVRDFVVAPFLAARWSDVEHLVLGELRGVWIPAQVAAAGMVARRRGSIVVVSSGLSRTTAPGFSAHSAGKAACDALARSLAAELGPHGVRVNVVAPGLTDTDATTAFRSQAGLAQVIAQRTPMGRIATPEDIAGVIALLLSDEARFVTGAYIPVSGGALMP